MSKGSTPSHNPDSVEDFTGGTAGIEYAGSTPLHNPEPPAELLESLNADTIGHTVFSKHWLFTTLMKLIQEVDKHVEAKESGEAGEAGFDVEESLQDELCKLWDMSMNPEVASFLQEFKAIDILTGVIAKSQAPRATEICVGILGNMACNSSICREMAENEKLVDLILMLLENPDPPTLVETTRLIYTCVCETSSQTIWMNAIKNDPSVFTNIKFILHSSTNRDLLQNTGELLDKLMDMDEELCETWSSEELVMAVLEASKQLGTQPTPVLNMYIHVLQLISTSETGVEALVCHAQALSDSLLKYLLHVCSDVIIILTDNENSLSSCVSVLNILFTSWQQANKMINESIQLMRCIVKIFAAAYTAINKLSQSQASDASDTEESKPSQSDAQEQSGSNNHGNGDHNTNTDNQETEAGVDSNLQQTSKSQQDTNVHETRESKDKRLRRKSTSISAELTTLYDLLLGFQVDILVALQKEKESEKPVAEALKYLSDSCSRQRISHVVLALSDWHESDAIMPVQCLQELSHHYSLDRLEKIVKETLSDEKP